MAILNGHNNLFKMAITTDLKVCLWPKESPLLVTDGGKTKTFTVRTASLLLAVQERARQYYYSGGSLCVVHRTSPCAPVAT